MNNPPHMFYPLFLKLGGRKVLLVGGGPVATAKAAALADAGAKVTVVSPTLTAELESLIRLHQESPTGSGPPDGQAFPPLGWFVDRRPFQPQDLDGAWLVIAAAPPEVNRQVAETAEARRIFVVAVDDPPACTAYGAGVVRRAGVTVAISTGGEAPALAGLLREGLDALLPPDIDAWVAEARRLRPGWRAQGIAMADRRPRLLAALNGLYPPSEGAGG